MTFNSCLITFEILSANMNKKKSIFLITSVLLLSYFMILINDASAAAGDITPVRVANHVALGEGSSVNLEHDTESGKYNSMVQVDADTYALAYSGRDNDGFISTFTISADGATITEVETIEHDRYEADYNSLVQVDADTYALAYSGTNGDGFISTFTIDSGGDITPIKVASYVALGEGSSVNLEHDTTLGRYNSLVQVDADTYALAYAGTNEDGFISTFTISADGATITEVNSLEHDTDWSKNNSMVQVDADTYALAYAGVGSDGFISTFTISADGATITEVNSLEHDTDLGTYNSLVQVDADTYALAYAGLGADGFISTFTISADGATITEVESLEHDDSDGKYNSLVQVDADTYALAYADVDKDGFISTFTIDSGGDITPIKVANYATLGEGSSVNLEHDTTLGEYNSLVQVDADTYALAYAGVDNDGFISTFTIDGSAVADDDVTSTVEINDSTTNGPTLTNSDSFGVSVANIGDLNGDGVDDIAVGANYDDNAGDARGAIHIMFMNTDGTIDSTVEINSSTTNGPTLTNGDFFGRAIANIGDLNGDGVNDIAVGANADDNAGGDRGAIHIMFMNTDGTIDSTVEINDSTTNGPTLTNSDSFGVSVANIGDLNGDGVNDIAVGANQDDDGGTDRGAIHIMFMNTDGTIDSTVEINDSTTNGPTLTNSDFFGVSVANIGDLNGDGVNDIAVGANLDDNAGDGRGAIHIMFMTGSASASASASTSSSDCCDRKPPTLQDARIIISSNDPIVATGNDPIHITANVGDTISVILKVTDNKSLDTSRFAGLYTNFIERPDDMSLFYANHYNNLKQVSTSFYEWNVRSDDVAYNYDDTVSWNQTTPFIVTEDTTVDNFIFKNDDHNAVEFFMIPFTMIVNDSMESTQITITVTDAAGNRLHQTLPVILEILGHAPPDFNSNGKVLGFFNESVLDIMILELNGSEDTAPLSALLGISDELLPAWTLDLATWVAEDKIDSADLIVAVEYLINQ